MSAEEVLVERDVTALNPTGTPESIGLTSGRSRSSLIAAIPVAAGLIVASVQQSEDPFSQYVITGGNLSVGISDHGPASEPRRFSFPRQMVDPHVRTYLNRSLSRLLSSFSAVAITAGITSHVPIEAIQLRTFTDPEEGWTKITCDIEVGCAISQGLAFWDYLGTEVDRWVRTLPPDDAATFVESVSVHVDWK